jgi:lipopolysaccharide export LptBFGC system permease protein LptF
MYFTLFGSMVIAAIIGYVSEKSGFTRNGIIPSIIICLGGVFLFFFITVMFRVGFGSPGLNAIIASVGALVIVPTHWRK